MQEGDDHIRRYRLELVCESGADERTYAPKHLAENILTIRSALEGERKQVTLLFVDVRGSTDLGHKVRIMPPTQRNSDVIQNVRVCAVFLDERMTIRIETPTGRDALTEFVRFHDRAYENRDVHWPATVELELPILLGESPFNAERRMRPFAAREDGAIVARALAIVDKRYQRHWNEKLGHVVMFEALHGRRNAVRQLMDESCEWLASQGAVAARAGMGMLDTPFVVDEYDSLPPEVLRYNPAHYHSLLKDAGFETEKGWVDYKIAVTPDLVARWQSALEASRRSGVELVPLADVPESKRIAHFTDTWADTFKAHWGWTAFSEDEIRVLLDLFVPEGALDTSLLAYRDGVPVGFLVVVPEVSALAVTKPGREVRDDEKLNFLGIGVRESARGRGVNLGMAARTYLELVKRGAKYLSYTLVLDDNWPSRRTGEKLGAYVCANYVTYRRNFRR